MSEKIPPGHSGRTASGSAEGFVDSAQEQPDGPKLNKTSVIESKVAELEQWMKILVTMPPGGTRDLAAKSVQRGKSLVRDLLSDELDLECFATKYEWELKSFHSYVKPGSIEPFEASLNEVVAAASTMDQIKASEETELRLTKQEEGQSIQIGVTNGKPVRMTNTSHGGGLQIGGHMSDAQLQAILRNLRSA